MPSLPGRVKAINTAARQFWRPQTRKWRWQTSLWRFAGVLLLILFSALITSSSSAVAAAPRPQIRFTLQGKVQYLYLSDIALYYGMRYAVSGKVATLSSSYSRIIFTLDSRIITLNGVKVHLGFAVSRRAQDFLFSYHDFKHLLDPIMRPRSLPRRHIQRIMLDPGHGGKDTGALAAGVQEKNVNLQVANRLAAKLRQKGYVVAYTRTRDTAVSLQQRVANTNRWGADLFVSLHCNSAAATTASGIEIFSATVPGAPPTGDKVLATTPCPANDFDRENAYLTFYTQKALLNATKAIDRGIKHRRFYVIKDIKCPGMLIEMGFLSNPTERQLLQQPNRQDAIAQAITDAIEQFKTAVAPEKRK